MNSLAPVWSILLGAVAGLAGLWMLLIIFLAFSRPRGSLLKEAARLLPDTLGLLRRIAGDRTFPRGVRVRLWLLFVYLASPIDLIPDFLPVVGYVDDVILICVVLRAVVRKAGPDAVRRHWRGSPAGLGALWRLAGLPGRADPDASPGEPGDVGRHPPAP